MPLSLVLQMPRLEKVGAVEKVFLTAKHAKVCAKYAKINH
jgi:hypothetical protein